MLRVHGLSREVFPHLNGITKSARLVVTYVRWHTTTYIGVGRNSFNEMLYHIQIHHKHSVDEYKINLTEEELIERIVQPYETGVPIVINGTTINLGLILRIKIFETEDNLDPIVEEFENRYKADRNASKIFDAAPVWKAIETGKDVTDKYITGPAGHKKEETRRKEAPQNLIKKRQ